MAGDPLELLIETRERTLVLIAGLQRDLQKESDPNIIRKLTDDLDNAMALLEDVEREIKDMKDAHP